MVDKLAWIVFFAGIALWYFGVRYLAVEIAIGIAALVLLILHSESL